MVVKVKRNKGAYKHTENEIFVKSVRNKHGVKPVKPLNDYY